MTHVAARVPVILALGLLAAFAGSSPAAAQDEPFPPDPSDVVKYSCRTEVGERICPFIVCVGAGSMSATVRICPDATD